MGVCVWVGGWVGVVCVEKGTCIQRVLGWVIGFDQLCCHNFRIIVTYLNGISIKHYSRIIVSEDTFKGVV